MNTIDFLRKDGSMIVNKRLAKQIGIESAIMFSELVSRFDYFEKKGKLVDGLNQQVLAAAENKPGVWSTQYEFLPLEDLVVFLDSPGKDLALAILDEQGKIIGFSDFRGKDFEILLMSSDHYQKVTIAVMNSDTTPANFGLKIFSIVW